MSIYEQYFDGRKPSENQVIEAIKRGLSRGHYQFEIAWERTWSHLRRVDPESTNGSAGAGSRIYPART